MHQRFGTFLFFVGFILIGMFILTDFAENPQFGYFFGAVLCIIGGIALWWRPPAVKTPPTDSGRFRIIRTLEERRKAKKK